MIWRFMKKLLLILLSVLFTWQLFGCASGDDSVEDRPIYSETYSKLMKQFTVTKPQYEDDYDSETAFDNIFGESSNNTIIEE